MKVLITGSTGFVGKTLVNFLHKKSIADMCLLVRNREKAVKLFSDLYPIISTNDSNWDVEIVRFNPDVVLHLAAHYTNQRDKESIKELLESNILFTTLLLEAVSHTSCSCFINIGTFTEYSDGCVEYQPNNLYSATKTAIRPILKYYQTQSLWKWINVVIYSPYGRRNESKKVIDFLLDAIYSDTQVDFSPGEQILDFIHVDDIADFFITLIQSMPNLIDSYYQFYLGTGQGHTIREVAQVMEDVFKKPVHANWGGRNYAPSDVMHAVAPINKNIRILGWKAKLSLMEGIELLRKDLESN